MSVEVLKIKNLGFSKKWKTDPPEYLDHVMQQSNEKRHQVVSEETGGAYVLMTCLDCAISWQTEKGC